MKFKQADSLKVKKIDSNLIKVYTSLKSILFSSQVVFYRVLFNFIREDNSFIIDILKRTIKECEKTQNFKMVLSGQEAKEFYKILRNYDEDWEITFPNIEDNIINTDSLRTSVNKRFHERDEKAFPKYWRKNYLEQNKRTEFKNELLYVIEFYIIMYHLDYIDLNSRDINLIPAVWTKINEKLSDNHIIHDYLDSIPDLVDVIVNEIYLQCDKNRKSSLMSQWDYFISNVECYGNRNINYLFSLKENYKNNVYCAYRLGTIYYFGATFYSESTDNPVTIKQDYNEAYKCYSLCAKYPNIIPGACWTMGYMIYNDKVSIESDKKIEKAIELFKKCGNYAPALNNLGLINKEKADLLYLNDKYKTLSPSERKECKELYLLFIEQCYSASLNNWVYSYNNLYKFYYDSDYELIRNELKEEKRFLDLDPLSLLKISAEKKNPWAMDKLACHYICMFILNNIKAERINLDYDSEEALLNKVVSGQITLKLFENKKKDKDELLLKAKSLLKFAHEEANYNRATFHLAINYFYDKPIYGNLLEKAAQQGNEQATHEYNNIMNEYFL